MHVNNGKLWSLSDFFLHLHIYGLVGSLTATCFHIQFHSAASFYRSLIDIIILLIESELIGNGKAINV